MGHVSTAIRCALYRTLQIIDKIEILYRSSVPVIPATRSRYSRQYIYRVSFDLSVAHQHSERPKESPLFKLLVILGVSELSAIVAHVKWCRLEHLCRQSDCFIHLLGHHIIS